MLDLSDRERKEASGLGIRIWLVMGSIIWLFQDFFLRLFYEMDIVLTPL